MRSFNLCSKGGIDLSKDTRFKDLGDFCLIGAGCVVGQGIKVPDNSFVVGVPGRIKGKPTAQQVRWIQEGPRGYAEIARQYRE